MCGERVNRQVRKGILSQEEIDALLGDSMPLDVSPEGEGVEAHALGELFRVCWEGVLGVPVKLTTIDVLVFSECLSELGGADTPVLQLHISGFMDSICFVVAEGPEHSTSRIESAVVGLPELLGSLIGATGEVRIDKAVQQLESIPVDVSENVVLCRFTAGSPPEELGFSMVIPGDVASYLGGRLTEMAGDEAGGDSGGRQTGTIATARTDQIPGDQAGGNGGKKPGDGSVEPMQFQPLTRVESGGHAQQLDIVKDVLLEVTVELGAARLTIGEAMDVQKGDVVELDKLAGEPVDIMVNGKLIARGEVIVIDEYFGVKITDIVEPAQRI